MATTGVRQEVRHLEKAIDAVDKRVDALSKGTKIKISRIAKSAGSSYDELVMQTVIDKLNEVIDKLAR